MNAIHPQYITDEYGKKVSVIIPLPAYEQMLEELDELNDIVLYDEAKTDGGTAISFDEYVSQRRSRK